MSVLEVLAAIWALSILAVGAMICWLIWEDRRVDPMPSRPAPLEDELESVFSLPAAEPRAW